MTLTKHQPRRGGERVGDCESYVRWAEGWAGEIEAHSRGRLDMTLHASAHVETMVSRSQGWALHFAL